VSESSSSDLATSSPGHEAVLAEVAAGSDDDRREVAVAFARAALRRVGPDQLDEADAARTAGQLLDAFRFADGRAAGELDIRVLAPEVTIAGSRRPGAVIQVSSEDRPFLLSTVTEELGLRGLEIVRSLHPIIGVRRGDDGRIAEVQAARTAAARESFLHIELDERLDDDTSAALTEQLRHLLSDVVAATGDYESMRTAITGVAERLRREPSPGVDPQTSVETAALLSWILDDNFVILGTREYEIVTGPQGDAVRVVPGSGLGILADESTSHYGDGVPIAELSPELRQRVLDRELLKVSRTNRLSTVHRRARMDYVGIKRIGADGGVGGEFRLVGLFTRKGYTEPARTTPVLRRKLRDILEREDVVEGSHDETTLISLFQALPKDELFQADVETLHELLVGLFHAEEHRQIGVMTRIDRFTRTVSVLLAVPRDRYSPTLRRQLQQLLLDRYGGEWVHVDLSLGDRADALARFSVHLGDADVPDVPRDELEREIRALARSWSDDVVAALRRRHGEGEARRLAAAYIDRLPRTYRDSSPIDRSIADVELLDRLVDSGDELVVELHPPRPGSPLIRLTAVQKGTSLELSSFLPILESLGLVVVEEVPHTLAGDGPDLHVQDFGVRTPPGASIDVAADGERIAAATLAAWHGALEVDSLNRLVVHAGLDHHQVTVLRAYRRYRRQVGTAYTPGYTDDALVSHPEVVRALIELFQARFDPAVDVSDDDLQPLRQRVLDRCDAVERLDHDRIMRSFLTLIEATLRTNHYRSDAVTQRADGRALPYLALKLDPTRVPDVPKPVPYREIFVYSPLVEGIHLRGGPVARGGLRWSDRQDDVRTEVLGLMKAQMLKNAVIVPTGAKGGFVLKRPPTDRSELRGEVERQYVTFVRGLLDVTDNIVAGEVVPPPQVRRRDGDDPYLVVAADKGTATFSDRANAVAAEHGYWLGDAFASGGSRGYDHKELGITARGAWIAVQRHFRELGIDTQTEPITVVGIGDMSGDVFGNGMLSSTTIRLVAAFDHRDIFIDPDPDAEATFAERRRLFTTPGSTWQDFDREAISDGGGVWSRDVKRITIGERVRQLLRIDADELSPAELIQALLQAPVDLLWAGGIGTYVKASTEANDRIGDRANDEVRIDADTLRTRVFGEGANLSITQPARIQYARRGGRINQDAIDNAGGVDISDHEVNVKILLGLALESGAIDDEERDGMLATVTDDVVEHVLSDVDRQTALLSQEIATSVRRLDQYETLMRVLEEQGTLDREIEALPSTDELDERGDAGAGLTRPELATLMGYAKRALTKDLSRSPLPDQPALQPTLASYFPQLLVDRFGELLADHRLRRDLVATIVANDLVNRMGITFAFRLSAEARVPRRRVVAAYWVAREVTDAADAWDRLDALAGVLAPDRQLVLKQEIDALVAELTRTYLNEPELDDLAAMIERDRPVVSALRHELMDIGTATQRQRRVDRANTLMDDLVDPDLATYLACAGDLSLGPGVAAVVRSSGDAGVHPPSAVADAFLRLSSALGVDRLRRVLDRIEPEGRWARWQHGGLLTELSHVQREAVGRAFADAPTLPEAQAVQRFLDQHGDAVEHAIDLIREVESDDDPSLDAVGVAVRTLRRAAASPS
jgi:glutamate dehydrogenase